MHSEDERGWVIKERVWEGIMKIKGGGRRGLSHDKSRKAQRFPK